MAICQTAEAANPLLDGVVSDATFAAQIEAAISLALQEEMASALLIVAIADTLPVYTQDVIVRLNVMLKDISRYLQDYALKRFTLARLDSYVFGLIVTDVDTHDVAALDAVVTSITSKHFSIADQPPGGRNCTIGRTLIDGREQRPGQVITLASRNLQPQQFKTIIHKILQGQSESARNAAMLDQLTAALPLKRFRLMYQPVVHIKGANNRGYEVLSRMLESDGNELMPDAYIHVANLHGIGEQLDKLVISMALDSAQTAADSGFLIINIASNTLASATFIPWLRHQLQSRNIPSEVIYVAISAADIHHNAESALDFCRGLDAAGMKLVISHFGCNPDPCKVLSGLKPHLVKLHHALLKDVDNSAAQRTALQDLIKTLHNLRTLVIAPQVESLGILPVLWDAGVDYVQGYGLQAPAPEMNYNFLVEEEITLCAGRI